ncbi:MAG: serpin family protein [Patescibacteria group bacterium]|nr:serpin family protein [Patescibacteria group bacterium]
MGVLQTRTVTTYTLANALLAAEEILGKGRKWLAANRTQDAYLKDFFLPKEALAIPEVESKTSWDNEVLNAFLREKGFDIQLSPFDSSTFGVVSILDLLIHWLVKGEKRTLNAVDKKNYPAVFLKHGVMVGRVSGAGHEYPIARIETQKPDGSEAGKTVVYMTPCDNPPEDGFDLIRLVTRFSNCFTLDHEYEGVTFPMIDLDVKPNVSWLLQMSTTDQGGQPWEISQAMQQTKLRLNEIGVHLKDAMAIGVRCISLPKQPFEIDRPFLLWVTRQGLSFPLFTGFLRPDVWKEPAAL